MAYSKILKISFDDFDSLKLKFKSRRGQFGLLSINNESVRIS